MEELQFVINWVINIEKYSIYKEQLAQTAHSTSKTITEIAVGSRIENSCMRIMLQLLKCMY